ncbi:hypothetical protein Tco_0732348 [Tanacetum coccineum]
MDTPCCELIACKDWRHDNFHELANPEGDQVRIDVSRPLPLSGSPGHVTSLTQFFFNIRLDLVYEYGSKGMRTSLSIFQNKGCSKFYIDRHTDDSSRKAVRTHMRILSVVRFTSLLSYGMTTERDHVQSCIHQDYMISKKGLQKLVSSDFEDLNMMLLQGHLNHLPGSDIRMLSTAIKLWTRNFVI